MIKVYHNNQFISYVLEPDTLKNTTLVLAGIVNTDDLVIAFERTNNIDSFWRNNHDVFYTGKSARSTSVGDVLVKDNEYHVVELLGFRKLEDIQGMTFQDPEVKSQINFVAPKAATFKW
jgi:hypothetical protein